MIFSAGQGRSGADYERAVRKMLSGAEGGADGPIRVGRAAAGNINVFRAAHAVFVVNTVCSVTVYRKLHLRRLHSVSGSAVPVKTGAAGAGFVLSLIAAHLDGVLAAAVVCVVSAAGYITA